MRTRLFDYQAFEELCVEACGRYEQSAPAVRDYIDALYMRVNDRKPVQLAEIVWLESLASGSWLTGNGAQNSLLHHLHTIGADITGLIDH